MNQNILAHFDGVSRTLVIHYCERYVQFRITAGAVGAAGPGLYQLWGLEEKFVAT